MMIQFRSMRWKNLLSTGNVLTEIDFVKHTTTLIVGDNGAGKSTILDALSFVLFGKPFRNINKPQMVNSINKKDMLVEIDFYIGQDQYTIKRGIKPAIFEIWKNTELVNQNAESRDYQEVLEKQILKINYKAFCQVVVIGSASFVPFMALTAAHRRTVIEDILDLQIFTRMNSILRDEQAENAETITKISGQIKVLEEVVSIHKNHEMVLQASNDKMVEEKQERIKNAEKERDKALATKKKLVDKVQKLQEGIKDAAASKSKFEKLALLKNQLGVKLKNVQQELSFFEHSDSCPTCTQQIDVDFRKKAIEDKTLQIKTMEDTASKMNLSIEKINKRLEDIDKDQDEIKKLNLELSMNQAGALEKYINNVRKEIETLTTVFEQVDQSQLGQHQDKLTKASEEYNQLVDQKQLLTTAAILLKDSGIKAMIIKQYVPIINKLINKYLASMEFYINFELNEQFEETIKSRFRDEFTFASFSEGEKMRINLALLFAWRAVAAMRSSFSTNLLIFDEIFDSSLDASGTEEFIKIVKGLTKGNNTFIISHKTDQIYDKFDNVLLFEKHKNFSQISERGAK